MSLSDIDLNATKLLKLSPRRRSVSRDRGSDVDGEHKLLKAICLGQLKELIQ